MDQLTPRWYVAPMISCEIAVHSFCNDPDCSASASDERGLIERSATDPAAIGALYRRHYPAIARYIRRRIGCSHDAEDLIAETFVGMVKYLPRFRVRSVPFRSWLYRLATTQVNRWTRRRRRAAIRELSARAQELASHGDDDGEKGIDRDGVHLALMSLPPRFQAVLSLHYMEGMCVEEIAEVLQCAPGTVKSRLARGREKMRQQLLQLEARYARRE